MDRFILYPLFLAALAAIAFLGWQLFEYATALPTWQAALAQSRNELRTANGEIRALEQESAQLRGEVAQTMVNLEATAQTLASYRNAFQEANDTIGQANETIKEQGQRIITARDQLNATRNERNAALQSLEVERQNLAAEKQTTRRQASRITSLQGDIRSKDSQITQLSDEISQQNTQISWLNSQVSGQRTQINQQNSTIANLRTSLNEARNQQVSIPACSTNYYTAIGGQLSCVARNSAAFQATQTESRDINLPQTGRVTLKINRSGELGSDQSMDFLEHSVRTIEEYMGQPIPFQGKQEVRLNFMSETQCSANALGCHVGTHMEVREELENPNPQSGSNWYDKILGIDQQNFSEKQLANTIAHEVAHYYWTAERTWLHEGAAEFLALYSESLRTGAPIRAQNPRCSQVSNIRQLEAKRYESGDDGSICNYSLGEGLFVDLYNAMSATGFRQSFRELYASGKNKLAGVHQVRQAYLGSWSIIDRWYGYREKPEAHFINGDFLGYTTWQESGEWRTYTRNGRPCATSLRMNDNPTRYEPPLKETRDECYYTGTWSPEGDLLVTIDGATYRAVEVKIEPPRY